MANTTKPLFRPGHEVSVVATADVTGATFVGISAARGADGLINVATAGSGDPAFGVATRDIKSGAIGSVIREGIVPVAGTGSIEAGDQVEVGADGKAAAANSGVVVGIACDDIDDGVVLVALSL